MKNRQALLIIGALAVAIAVTGFMGIQLGRANDRLEAARSTLASLEQDKDAFIEMNMNVRALERKRNVTRVEGIAQAVEDVLGSIGLKDKLTSVKPVPSRDPEEDRAEVALELIDLNEMANIIHAVDNAPMLLIIRKAGIKASFLRPGLMDMSLTISLIKPEPQKQ